MGKRIILNTASGDPCNNTFAVVEPTEQLVDLILQRIAIVKRLKQKEDTSLYALEFWDATPEYVCSVGNDLSEALDNDDYVVADYEVSPDDLLRVDCTTMVVTDNDMIWKACLKNSDVTIETYAVPVEFWKKLAGRERGIRK